MKHLGSPGRKEEKIRKEIHVILRVRVKAGGIKLLKQMFSFPTVLERDQLTRQGKCLYG